MAKTCWAPKPSQLLQKRQERGKEAAQANIEADNSVGLERASARSGVCGSEASFGTSGRSGASGSIMVLAVARQHISEPQTKTRKPRRRRYADIFADRERESLPQLAGSSLRTPCGAPRVFLPPPSWRNRGRSRRPESRFEHAASRRRHRGLLHHAAQLRAASQCGLHLEPRPCVVLQDPALVAAVLAQVHGSLSPSSRGWGGSPPHFSTGCLPAEEPTAPPPSAWVSLLWACLWRGAH